MGAKDEGFAFEEIGGARYALWTAESEPFGTRQAFSWPEFAVFLGGICVFGLFQWFLIVLAVFDVMATKTALVGLAIVGYGLLAALVPWAFRKRRGLATALHKRWFARNPEAKGAPCSLRMNNWPAYCATWGLAFVEGPWLVFRGTRCDVRLIASDAASSRGKQVLRFTYSSPFGKRTAILVFGGPSMDGWVGRSKAAKAIAADLATWRIAQDVGGSIFPPLRGPRVRFEPGFLTRTVPLMFLAYCTVFMGVESPSVWLFGPIPGHRTADFEAAYLVLLVTIYAMYLLVIAAGYGIRRLIQGRNRKIDALAASARRAQPSP